MDCQIHTLATTTGRISQLSASFCWADLAFFFGDTMESDEKTFPQAEQSETCVPEQAIGKGQPAEVNCHEEFQHSPNPRKDKNHFHATRHGVLSRYPLEALASLGENIRHLRRIERKFPMELKPSGFAAESMFGEPTYMPSDPTSAHPT
jgi:hypothetical protein